jgi:carboxyl-terminal processing protease
MGAFCSLVSPSKTPDDDKPICRIISITMKHAGPTRRIVLALGCLAALGEWSARSQPATPPAASSVQANRAALDEVWETVRDRFYDPHLHELDWLALRQRYQLLAASAASGQELAVVINTMLAELGASHTHYYTPEETAYYQLADIFVGALRRRGLDRVFSSGEVTYPGIGVFTHVDDQGRTFITGVVEGSPARRAGLLLGDQILSVDGLAFRPVASFREKVGAPVNLSIRRKVDASPMAVSVTPVGIHPNAMFLQGLQASARIITAANGVQIGYVHVWSYAGNAYQRALEDLIAEGPLRDADALIWDLRDGWGGAEPQYLELFNAHAPTMQMKDRRGNIVFVGVKWRKPVVMLVNGGTRSGKEVLAYGFKQYRLGEVIGTRSAGAVLAATAFLMGNGNLLLLAVSDVLVDGQRLEGVGVTPTIEVPFDPAYAAGMDPQLDRAVEVLSTPKN